MHDDAGASVERLQRDHEALSESARHLERDRRAPRGRQIAIASHEDDRHGPRQLVLEGGAQLRVRGFGITDRIAHAVGWQTVVNDLEVLRRRRRPRHLTAGLRRHVLCGRRRRRCRRTDDNERGARDGRAGEPCSRMDAPAADGEHPEPLPQPRPGHRRRHRRDAATGVGGASGEPQQARRVDVAVVSARDHDRIAGLLGQPGDLPLQPPGQRMEPEDRAVEQRDAGDERIAPAHVLLFVRQHRRQLGLVPVRPVRRQDDRRRDDSDGDRRDARRMRQPSLRLNRAAPDRASASQSDRQAQRERTPRPRRTPSRLRPPT